MYSLIFVTNGLIVHINHDNDSSLLLYLENYNYNYKTHMILKWYDCQFIAIKSSETIMYSYWIVIVMTENGGKITPQWSLFLN